MSNQSTNKIKFLKKRFLKISLILVAISLLIIGYRYFLMPTKKPPETPLKLVEVVTLKKQTIQQSISLIGTIRPLHTTTLIAKATGVFDALIATGQKVHKGDLIAKLDNPDIETNLKLTEASEKIANTQYERLKALLKTGYVSSKEVEEKKQTWIEAQKELSKTRIYSDTMRFYAPFDGIVGAYKMREGAEVNLGDSIVTIYDPTKLVVDFDIPCTNIATIKEGQTVYVINKKYTLSHIQRMIDDETHMCPADVAISCENCLIGSSVDIQLVVRKKRDVIVIPKNALFLTNGKPCVYIVKKGKIMLIPVKTGLQDKSRIEIISGIKFGQKLVTKGQERLYPDMEVKIYQAKLDQLPVD